MRELEKLKKDADLFFSECGDILGRLQFHFCEHSDLINSSDSVKEIIKPLYDEVFTDEVMAKAMSLSQIFGLDMDEALKPFVEELNKRMYQDEEIYKRVLASIIGEGIMEFGVDEMIDRFKEMDRIL